MDARVEEALQTLTDITEVGGYMKRETKEEILKAVSEKLLYCAGKRPNS